MKHFAILTVVVLLVIYAAPLLAQPGYPGPATPTPGSYPGPLPTATTRPLPTPTTTAVPGATIEPRPTEEIPTGVSLSGSPNAAGNGFNALPFSLAALAFAAISLWRKR